MEFFMNIEKLLHAFNQSNVRYVVTAVERNRNNATSQRVRVEIEPTPLNALRVLNTLHRTGLAHDEMTLQDIFNSREISLTLGNPAVGAKVALGDHFFDRTWYRKHEEEIGHVSVFVAKSVDLKTALSQRESHGFLRLYTAREKAHQ